MIYFIQDQSTYCIKIGFTDGEAMDRLKALQTGCPAGLSLLSTMSGDKSKEKELHAKFADLWERGEWFRPGAELISYLLDRNETSGAVIGRGCMLFEIERFAKDMRARFERECNPIASHAEALKANLLEMKPVESFKAGEIIFYRKDSGNEIECSFIRPSTAYPGTANIEDEDGRIFKNVPYDRIRRSQQVRDLDIVS